MNSPTRADLATIVRTTREAMRDSFWQPVLKRQAETTRDREARGPCWVSRLRFRAPPQADARRLLLDTIKYLGTGTEKFPCPPIADVPVHWVGRRKGVGKDAPEPNISAEKKFKALNQEVENPLTCMYMYGGAHYINGPATRRLAVTTLATLTKGRCLIVQHRLAPQNAFPCALLDVLHAYLSLLYPPPNSPHKAVPSSQLILTGDSSGAQLAMALLQTILSTHQSDFPYRSANRTISFHGHHIALPLPLPAGVALQSPGLDTKGDCLPSWHRNAEYDIFPNETPSLDPRFPADAAWPTTPPRGNLYTDASCLGHPLVSPMTARSWAGAPPLYIAVGSREQCVDAVRFVAQSAARAGVAVVWDEYEDMPHNWPMLLKGWPHARLCYERWAEACLVFWRRSGGEIEVQTDGRFTEFEGLQRSGNRKVNVLHLSPFTVAQIRDLVRQRVAELNVYMERRLAGQSML